MTEESQDFGVSEDNVPEVEINKKTSQIVKCKSCGADMVFDIEKGKLACPYCDSTEGIDANVFDIEHSLDNFDESALRHEEGTITYQCPNCHAKTQMHAFGTSAKCPFCGATNILEVDELPGLAPDAILPFKITREAALEGGKKWIKKRLFAPTKLKKNFNTDNMNALYAPVFTFDSDTCSVYEGRLGENYTVMVGSGKNRHAEIRTRWFRVSGTYDRYFDDVLIEVSPSLLQSEVDKVGEFDTANAVEYTKEYIAGFASERHNVGVNEAFETAKQKMSEILREEILSKYKYDKVDYLNVNTSRKRNTFKQILVPLWCCAYKFKEKLYKYLVNGRTGQAGGKAPLSPIKVGIAVILGIAVVALFVYLSRD